MQELDEIEQALKDAEGLVRQAMVRLSESGTGVQKLYGESSPLAQQVAFAVTHSALLDGYIRDALAHLPPPSAP